MTLVDIAIILIIKRLISIFEMPQKRVIIYAWSPLVIFEISGNSHLDVMAVFFLLLSVLLILMSSDSKRYRFYSGVSLALGFLVKFFPIVMLPFLIMKWGIRGLLGFIGTTMTCTLLYIESGVNPLYPEGLRIFREYFRFNESGFRVYRYFLSNSLNIQDADMVARDHYIAIMIVLSLIIVIYYNYNQIKAIETINMTESVIDSIKSYQIIVLFALLLGPDVQPWYLLWLLPFTLFHLDWAIISFSVTVLLSYQIYPEYARTHIWKESHLILLLEYVFVYLILVINIVKSGSNRMRG
jgi:4-amino-4-deoxy-L-arabinose transferase-like glycosyltransferase